MQLQDQVVGPQARHVRRRVPAVQRVVEFVGEKDGFQLAGLPDLAVPLRAVALVVGAIEELADVLGRDPIVGKSMKRPRDLQQPGILDRRIDAIEIFDEVLARGSRGRARARPARRASPPNGRAPYSSDIPGSRRNAARPAGAGSMWVCGSKIGQRAISSKSSRAGRLAGGSEWGMIGCQVEVGSPIRA